MVILEILSWVGTGLACIANIPQIMKIHRLKSVKELSLSTNVVWLFIVLVMFIRALVIVHDLVFIVSQGVQSLIMIYLVVFIIRHRKG